MSANHFTKDPTLTPVARRMYVDCLGQKRKFGPGDNTCVDCHVITREAYAVDAYDTFRQDVAHALHVLNEALKP